MRSSGLPIHHIFNIPLKNFNKPVHIVFLGDIHYGAGGFSDKEFNKFCKVLDRLENTYFVLMGDSLDFASRKERQQLINNPSIHETTRDRLNDMAVELADDLIHKLSFMKGRLIGAIDGNHNYPMFINGAEISTEAYIAHHLGGKFLGELGMVSLRFAIGNKKLTKTVVVHHGRGGGRTLGGSLNGVCKLADVSDGDVFCMGHDHQLVAGKRSHTYLGRSQGDIKQRVQTFLRSGSYLTGYQHNIPSYIVSGLWPPDLYRQVKGKVETIDANVLATI
ncbi:MAG: hypothetical protein ACYTBJ_27355 [Planctomycetota bacterium]|jgi:predicted phosphodiesterase